MRYLQRDDDGRVIGHYANPQSFATEEVPDDHPDLVAWDAARKAAAIAGPTIGELAARLDAMAAELAELTATRG